MIASRRMLNMAGVTIRQFVPSGKITIDFDVMRFFVTLKQYRARHRICGVRHIEAHYYLEAHYGTLLP